MKREREGKNGLIVLNPGSTGAVTEESRQKEKWKRETEMGVVMGLMCNKLHKGVFRETLL